MSRIGKAPIDIPDKVEVSIDNATNTVTVKGPKGTLSREIRPEISVALEDKQIVVTRKSEDRKSRSLHGLSRTLINNMVLGVSEGFTKNLELVGVGYRAQVQGNKLNMTLGFSNPVVMDIPDGIEVKVDANTKIAIAGFDKQLLGDFTASIRSMRPPEPYKGKGVRYAGERVRRKAGKAGK